MYPKWLGHGHQGLWSLLFCSVAEFLNTKVGNGLGWWPGSIFCSFPDAKAWVWSNTERRTSDPPCLGLGFPLYPGESQHLPHTHEGVDFPASPDRALFFCPGPDPGA